MTVHITAFGLWVIPVTLLLLLIRPGWLLGWTLFLSVFQAAAVIVVQLGTRYPIGLQPAFAAAPLALLAWFLARRPKGWLTPSLGKLCVPLYAFALFAMGSAVVFPRIFQGLLVESPREGLGVIHLVPLHLSLTNLSFAVYLACCVLLFTAVAEQAAADPSGEAGRRLVHWILAGIAVAAMVGFYQVLAAHTGLLPYPHGFFNSNPAYAQIYNSAIAGQARLNGTFTEASVAAWYFGAATVYCLWQVLFTRQQWLYLLVLALSGTALVLTAASTAYLILVGIALLVVLRLLLLRRVTARTAATLLVAGLFLLAAVFWVWRHAHHVHRLLDTLLFGKWRTQSYFQRAFSNRVAWHVLLATHGLGAGLGSLRASSLFTTLLGTVGVIGVGLALWFAVRLARREWRVCSLARLRFPFREGLIVGLAAMLGAGFVSIPDVLVYLPFWAFAGIYAATLWRALHLPAAMSPRTAAHASRPGLTVAPALDRRWT